MLEAAFWGCATSIPLVIGALIALAWRPPLRMVGLILGFGSGALISAVAYELIGDAIEATAWRARTLRVGLRRGAVGQGAVAGHDRVPASRASQASTGF